MTNTDAELNKHRNDRGNSTFINSFHKTKFLFHSSADVVAQFLEKLEILFDETFSRVDHALKILTDEI